ncbi:hypothetical protein GCM10008090_10230 [Arenicella chitinivorans]|uniref:Uncharacterized protein n=1 Tax=Arenicella chitinivorans TaxID=1329800 RepID=A0A918VKD9_9GAMM|nr:hypothetical protein GCM10008090_10230 [Arenicella chitinivorans]
MVSSLGLSVLLVIWGMSLSQETSVLTMHELSISAPQDILGLGYWPIWAIIASFQIGLIILSAFRKVAWSKLYLGCIFICAAAFVTATDSSFSEYVVLEEKVLG